MQNVRKLLWQGLVFFSLTAVVGAAAAADVRWRLQGGYPSSLPILGEIQVSVAKRVDELSGGAFQMRFHEPGAMVGTTGIFDAVSKGAFEVGFAGLGFWPGKDPALAVLNAVPFGPGLENIGWMTHGGGTEIADEILARHNIKAIPCGLLEPEAAGWFKKEVRSVDDLKGLKMRISGLGGKVLEKFGVSSMVLGGGEIYPALDRGVIDAAEFSMPAIDRGAGLHQIAKFYYFPGWHQPATWTHMLVNLNAWEKLPKRFQTILVTACEAETLRYIGKAQAKNSEALEFFRTQGVNVKTFDAATLQAFRKAWEEVAADEAAKSPSFKKVYESQRDFQRRYKPWKDLGYAE